MYLRLVLINRDAEDSLQLVSVLAAGMLEPTPFVFRNILATMVAMHIVCVAMTSHTHHTYNMVVI